MISLFEIVKELNIQKKDVYGSGSFHRVYPLKNHPDKVVKIPYNKEEWKESKEQLKIFNQYPDIFPKVYKITDKYAVIEKLDDKKAHKDINASFGYLIELNNKYNDHLIPINYMKDSAGLTTGMYDLKKDFPGIYEESFNELKNILIGENKINLIKFLDKINEFIDKILSKIDHLGYHDIHDYQFAYDKLGNIKLIDF